MLTTRGGKNLAILGIGAIVLASITTGVSLFIYRTSGDIYLDRSRPGYLPDREEATEETDASTSYSFPETGELSPEELEEYLHELGTMTEHLKSSSDAYSPSPLSDESLGIASELPED